MIRTNCSVGLHKAVALWRYDHRMANGAEADLAAMCYQKSTVFHQTARRYRQQYSTDAFMFPHENAAGVLRNADDSRDSDAFCCAVWQLCGPAVEADVSSSFSDLLKVTKIYFDTDNFRKISGLAKYVCLEGRLSRLLSLGIQKSVS